MSRPVLIHSAMTACFKFSRSFVSQTDGVGHSNLDVLGATPTSLASAVCVNTSQLWQKIAVNINTFGLTLLLSVNFCCLLVVIIKILSALTVIKIDRCLKLCHVGVI